VSERRLGRPGLGDRRGVSKGSCTDDRRRSAIREPANGYAKPRIRRRAPVTSTPSNQAAGAIDARHAQPPGRGDSPWQHVLAADTVLEPGLLLEDQHVDSGPAENGRQGRAGEPTPDNHHVTHHGLLLDPRPLLVGHELRSSFITVSLGHSRSRRTQYRPLRSTRLGIQTNRCRPPYLCCELSPRSDATSASTPSS
jgi:hypothetical protein